MTTLSPAVLLGDQLPRVASVPLGVSSLGRDATELCRLAGLVLDPWQEHALDCLLQQRADGQWQSRTGVLICPRQNGKGAVDEAVELAWLLLMDFPIVLHTAHHAKTAKNAFNKMRARIEGCDWLKKRLAADRSNGIRTANGEWGFTFRTGQQLIYGTRTSGAGRGLTIDAMVLDEAQELTDDELEALKPTTGAAPNPLTLWTGSAPKDHQEVLRRMMARGRAGEPGVCYLEHSVDEHAKVDLDDRRAWAQANPGYNIRRSEEALLDERMTLSDEGFGREILGIVAVDGGNSFATAWGRLQDRDSAITGLPTYALEVSEDRRKACVAAAGTGPAGLHVESGAYRDGTGWIVDFLADLASRRSVRVVVQPSSPAGSLISELEARRVTVVKASLDDYRAACGQFYDSVTDSGDIRHLGQAPLDISAREAEKKPSGDAWVWDRRTESTDISPLAAVTLAAWGSRQKPRAGRFMTF